MTADPKAVTIAASASPRAAASGDEPVSNGGGSKALDGMCGLGFGTCCSGECHAQSADDPGGPAVILSHQDQLDRQLLEAVDAGDFAGVQQSLLNGASIEGPPARAVSSRATPRGLRRPLLLVAAKHAKSCPSDTRMAELLLGSLADANATNQDGWTALFFAAQGGHSKLCKLLLEHAADPRRPDRTGLNALDYARDLEMRRELEKILQERGITAPRLKELAPATGRMLRQSAAETKNFTAVVNAQDRHGRTALHIAADSNNIDVVRKLLAREDFTCLNARDKHGRTALTVAEERGHDQVVLVLRDVGGVL